MKTNILLTLALVMGMMLVGCSKDESSEEPKSISNMEQANALTKEQIVGVWRNGNYWVSFAEDGFMCGYLSDKCIVEGGYEVFQNQVIVVSDFFEHNITMFKVLSVTENALKCDIKYSEIEVKSTVVTEYPSYTETIELNDAEATITFAKSQEKPTLRENDIMINPFKFYSTYELSHNVGWKDLSGEEINCQSVGRFVNDGSTIRRVYKLMENGTINPGFFIHMKDLYVYLSPYVYLIEHHDEDFNEEVPWFMLHPYKIQKMIVSFSQSGEVLLTE